MVISDPTGISDCIIWLDATDLTTLSSFSATNIDLVNNKNYNTLSNGDRIGYWGNKVGNQAQYNFVNYFGLTSNRPYYNTSLSAIEFVGETQSFLTADFNSSISNQTVVVFTMPKGGCQGHRIFTQHILNRDDSSDLIPLIQAQFNGNIGSFQNAAYRSEASITRSKGKFSAYFYNYTTLTSRISVCVNLNTPTLYTTSPTMGAMTVARMRMGGRIQTNGNADTAGSTASHYDGLVREVIVYNKSISSIERESLMRYLSGKWDLERHQEGSVYALQTGNWDTILWSTSSLPCPSGDIVFSNGFNVFINRSLSARCLNNNFGGGGFVMNDKASLSGFVYGGTLATACLNFISAFPSTASFVGILCAGDPSAPVLRPVAFNHSNSGTFNISGHCIGMSNNDGNADTSITASGCILNSGAGTLNLVGTYIGDIRANSADRRLAAVRNNSVGTVNLIGVIRGGVNGSNSSTGLWQASTGTINVSGLAIGGGGDRGHAIACADAGTGSINVIGTLQGGAGTNCGGISNLRSLATIYGNVFGGNGVGSTGISNPVGGSVFVYGSVYGGAGSDGITNSSVGTVLVTGSSVGGSGSDRVGVRNSGLGSSQVGVAVANAWGRNSSGVTGPSVGIANSNIYGLVTLESLQIGSNGLWPTAGNILLNHVESTQLSGRSEYYYNSFTAFDTKTNSASGIIFLTTKRGGTTFVPVVSNVRQGAVYDLGSKTGTCILPIKEVVLRTEGLNDGFGSANFDSDLVWKVFLNDIRALSPNSIGRRLINAISIEKTGGAIRELR
jgi:hypothetical protein